MSIGRRLTKYRFRSGVMGCVISYIISLDAYGGRTNWNILRKLRKMVFKVMRCCSLHWILNNNKLLTVPSGDET